MNSRIRKLKIKNYKSKINDIYGHLNIHDIYSSGENECLLNCVKKAHNDLKCDCYHFPLHKGINDDKKETDDIYRRALSFFFESLLIFKGCERVVFPIKYNDERLLIECDTDSFLSNVPNIEHLHEYPFVIDSNLTSVVSIMRLEYEFEVCTLTL